MPEVVFHSLRHTSVTYKLKLNRGDIKSVQGDSGHAQVSMVTDVYSHIIDEDRKKNAERFEEAFYGKKNLITYTKFALESHRYFSCSKTSHRTEAPRFPLFRIAENPLTNYPRGGIIILYGNVYGNGNGNERHRQQTCVKTNAKSAPAPPGRAEHSLPRQSDG